ncbi:hypothetical protein MMC07_007593 [Pseudocyphellaria aurata]|nr:hypothetical protein [Pseudocyphellaria aurata]
MAVKVAGFVAFVAVVNGWCWPRRKAPGLVPLPRVAHEYTDCGCYNTSPSPRSWAKNQKPVDEELGFSDLELESESPDTSFDFSSLALGSESPDASFDFSALTLDPSFGVSALTLGSPSPRPKPATKKAKKSVAFDLSRNEVHNVDFWIGRDVEMGEDQDVDVEMVDDQDVDVEMIDAVDDDVDMLDA